MKHATQHMNYTEFKTLLHARVARTGQGRAESCHGRAQATPWPHPRRVAPPGPRATVGLALVVGHGELGRRAGGHARGASWEGLAGEGIG
jgi:hypothetical protein